MRNIHNKKIYRFKTGYNVSVGNFENIKYMKIAQTTIIPIELFTYELSKYIERIFLDKGILKYSILDDKVAGICRELLPDETKFYYLNLYGSNVKVIFFIESGMVLLISYNCLF